MKKKRSRGWLRDGIKRRVWFKNPESWLAFGIMATKGHRRRLRLSDCGGWQDLEAGEIEAIEAQEEEWRSLYGARVLQPELLHCRLSLVRRRHELGDELASWDALYLCCKLARVRRIGRINRSGTPTALMDDG